MKTSTRKSSFETIEGVKGILFFQTNYTPRYITVEAWEAAGKPPNCFVYDGAHQLIAAGIPLVDAIEVENRWIRAPLPAVCPPTLYKRHVSLKRAIVRTSKIELVESEFITAKDARLRKIR